MVVCAFVGCGYKGLLVGLCTRQRKKSVTEDGCDAPICLVVAGAIF